MYSLKQSGTSRGSLSAGRKWVLLLGAFKRRKSVLTAIADSLKATAVHPDHL